MKCLQHYSFWLYEFETSTYLIIPMPQLWTFSTYIISWLPWQPCLSKGSRHIYLLYSAAFIKTYWHPKGIFLCHMAYYLDWNLLYIITVGKQKCWIVGIANSIAVAWQHHNVQVYNIQLWLKFVMYAKRVNNHEQNLNKAEKKKIHASRNVWVSTFLANKSAKIQHAQQI